MKSSSRLPSCFDLEDFEPGWAVTKISASSDCRFFLFADGFELVVHAGGFEFRILVISAAACRLGS